MVNLLRRFRGPSPRTQKAYEALVIRIADGEHVGEQDIEDVLEGRKVEDFQADVKRLLDRRAAVADLDRAEQLQKEHAKLTADVREAKAAFDNHPLQKAMIELQELGRRYEDLRAAAMQPGVEAAGVRGRAMHVLSTTASKDISDRTAEVSNEIRGLQNQQQQFALSEAETREYQAAQQDVAELPGRIAGLKGIGSAVESASLTARLVSQKQATKRFAERLAEAERIGKEMAKLGGKMDEVVESRVVPEFMEFTSKPQPREQ